jgi:hypothetical protein
MVISGIAVASRIGIDGLIMRRVIAIAVTGLSLAGCSSMDAFKSAPAPLQLRLDSVPPGADARTSLGQACKTPCSVSVPPPEGGFSVTYMMDKFQPATVAVRVIHTPGDLFTSATTKIDPNPVVAELQPAAPPPKAARKKMLKPKKPKAPDGTAAAPDSAASPFPQSGQAPPPPAH